MSDSNGTMVPTGIDGLDSVLNGGLPAGRLHLLQGSAGTGKTTLALQFAMAGLQRAESVLYVSLAETESEVRSIARSHGWAADDLTIFYHEPSALADEMQTVLSPAEFELPAALDVLLERIEATRPARLVIDSLAELRILAGDPRWYRRGLVRLRSRLEKLGCTSLLLDTADSATEAEVYLGSVLCLESSTPAYGPTRRRLQIVKMRGHDFATGYHDVRIRTGGLQVFRRLVAADVRRHFPPSSLSTGLAELDGMLGGGLDEGTAVLLLGPTGAGKSTLALQCAMAAAQRGEKVLVYIFDERTQTVFQRAVSLGFDLEAQVAAGRILVQQVDPAELTPGEFADRVRLRVRDDGVRLVVIDSLNAYLYAMTDERFLNVHLHELLAHLSQQSVTSILVGTQQVLTHDEAMLTPRLDVSYLADTVVLCRIQRQGGRRVKTVTVHKRRAGRHDDATRIMHLGSHGVSIGEVVGSGQGDERSRGGDGEARESATSDFAHGGEEAAHGRHGN